MTDKQKNIVLALVVLVLWVTLTIGLVGLIEEVGETRLGAKIEYWMSEPNDR